MEVVITVKDLRKSYDGKALKVLEGVSFDVRAGEFVGIIGPSGCGKSTLFNILTGLEAPTAGEVRVLGELPDLKQGKAAYMPQNDLLLPWRTVLDNVVLGLELAGMPRRERYEAAREHLGLFGLEGFEQKYPAELSGGMRQRAAFLRTVLTGRKILLLDEPFASLDALTRLKMQEWLLTVWQKFRHTVLFITHDIDEAVFLSDRVLSLSPRPASIVKTTAINLKRPRERRQVLSPEFLSFKQSLMSLLAE
jgi:ABC-type nitrate/sulfonate/bicarbonate transport system ATPase subunit